MKFSVFIASVIVLFAVANGAQLGSRRCTWGPAYWCQHLGTARECNSGEFCTQLWQRTHQQQSVDASPEECAFCKLLIADLEKQLFDNKTESEIRAEAEKACSLVPEQQLKSLCKSLVDTYLPEVLELIRQKLPPSKICSALSLCGNGTRDPNLITVTQPAKNSAKKLAKKLIKKFRIGESTPCDECEKVLQNVKEVIENNGTVDEIEQLLKSEVCSQLGPLRDPCNEMVDLYLPEVMVLLDHEIQPQQLCQLLGFCKAKQPKYHAHPVLQLMLLQKSPKKPLDSVECELCEVLVKDARELIRQNKTEQEIIEFLKQRVCSLLPAEQEKCRNAVTEYAPVIFQLLVSELDPVTVCQALGACGKSVGQSAGGVKVSHASQSAVGVKVGPECILCEYVLHELDKLIGENKTQQAVESALERVCSVLPATLGKDCDVFVQKYTHVVMQLIANDVNPALVCTVLGLCTGDSVPSIKHFVKPAVKSAVRPVKSAVKPAVKSATVCDICQTIISYAKSLLKENSTEEEITQVIEKACQFLPTAEQAACHSFIEQYAPYVIQLLLQDVEPQKICQALGLCTGAGRQRPQPLRYRPNGAVHMSSEGGR